MRKYLWNLTEYPETSLAARVSKKYYQSLLKVNHSKSDQAVINVKRLHTNHCLHWPFILLLYWIWINWLDTYKHTSTHHKHSYWHILSITSFLKDVSWPFDIVLHFWWQWFLIFSCMPSLPWVWSCSPQWCSSCPPCLSSLMRLTWSSSPTPQMPALGRSHNNQWNVGRM